MYRIGMMTYANMAPYRQLGEPEQCVFTCLTPRQSVQALKENQIIAAAVPVGGLSMLEGQVEYLGQFGIAAKAQVDSVQLFSDRPFEQMDASTCIRLTTESESSIRLLFLALGYEHGFSNLPRLTEEADKANGELLIGDKALKRHYDMLKTDKLTHITDLAGKWYQAHSHAFVFARWVVHKQAPQEAKDILNRWLQIFSGQESDLIEQCSLKTARELGLPENKVNHYLKLIRRCLNHEDMAGQDLFFKELKKHIRTPLFEKSGV